MKPALLGALALGLCACKSTSSEPAGPAPSASIAPSAAPIASVRDAAADRAVDAAGPAEDRGPFNVLLIVIDSLRADVQWHGYARPNAPRLTALAKQSIVYRRAYSISSTTARSIAPLLVGRYPSEMVRTGHYFTHWYPENLFLGERLKKAGHHSIAVHSHAYFFRGSGLDQGFDDYHVLPGTVFKNPEPEPTSERMTATARALLDRAVDPEGKRLVFAYLHYIDPHAPYLELEDRPAWGQEPRDFYDQEVHHTDDWVGALIQWVKKRSWGKRTAIIVTADHGECFGEHGQLKHGYELWQELVHVPLLIHVPGAAARVIDVPRSHIDLAPTILELMGVARDPPLRGKSLMAELFGAEPEPRPVVVDLPRDDLQDRRRALIDGDHKLIGRGDDERWLFYDLAKDPREKHNLAGRDPAGFRRMRKLYFELSEKIGLEEVRGDVPLKDAPEGRRW